MTISAALKILVLGYLANEDRSVRHADVKGFLDGVTSPVYASRASWYLDKLVAAGKVVKAVGPHGNEYFLAERD